MTADRMKDIGELLDRAVMAALEAGAAIMEVYGGDDLDVQSKADDSPVTVADLRADHIIRKRLRQTGLPLLSEEGADIPFGERKDWRMFWLVDPLDGTREFINGNGEFTVNIALVKDGNPLAGVVYSPVTDVLYTGIDGLGAWRCDNAAGLQSAPGKGIPLPCVRKEGYGIVASRSFLDDRTRIFIESFSRIFSGTRIVTRGSSLKLCMLAEGEADIYPRFSNISEWDTAAGHAILLASGGGMVQAHNTGLPVVYNKEDSYNPWFIAFRDSGLLEAVKGMIPQENGMG